jgi:hypothetical protein
MQFSYHVVIHHLFRPLNKEFVILNNCSISLGQTFKQRIYKCCLQVYLTIFSDCEMLIRLYTCYVCIENLCLFQKIALCMHTPVACVLLFSIKKHYTHHILDILRGNESTVAVETHCRSWPMYYSLMNSSQSLTLNCIFQTVHILKCLIENFG